MQLYDRVTSAKNRQHNTDYVACMVVPGNGIFVKSWCFLSGAEQQIWNECSRLIANAVIYYNTLLLSRVYAQKQAAGDHVAAEIVKEISPNAWQHVHLNRRV